MKAFLPTFLLALSLLIVQAKTNDAKEGIPHANGTFIALDEIPQDTILLLSGDTVNIPRRALPDNTGDNSPLARILPVSPQAAALARYGEYPVSHATGVPQITIPVYTVKTGDYAMPVSLAYHASGIKVDDVASTVGLGWSLDCGGVITRQAFGAPDRQHPDIDKTYYEYAKTMALADAYGKHHSEAAAMTLNELMYGNEGRWRYDSMSDRYTFNFAGKTGVFRYSYADNRYSSFNFIDGADEETEYWYNGAGALTKDLNRGMTIAYDNLNTPRRIDFKDGNSITYTYLPDGTLIRKSYGERKRPSKSVANILMPDSLTAYNGQIAAPDTVVKNSFEMTATGDTEYSGNMVYQNGKLDKILFPGGYCTFAADSSAPVFHYFTRDHLGSNRVVTDEDGTVEQIVHYYPFGGTFNDAGLNASLQQYKYNGKELDRIAGLNTYDYGARQYFPALPGWDRMDALCEKYYNISPYVFCCNNSINLLDINGDSIQFKGENSDVSQALNTLNMSTCNFADIGINTDGVLSMFLHDGFIIDELNRSDKNLYKHLDEIINGSGIAVVNVVKNSEDVIIGDIASNTIDVGDICNINAGAKMTSTSLIMHELYENYNVQVKNMDVKDAHYRSSRLEAYITGYMLDPWKRLINATGENLIPVIFPLNEEGVVFKTKNGNIIK